MQAPVDPLVSIKEFASERGLDAETTTALIEHVQAGYTPVRQRGQLRELKPQELLAIIEDRIMAALEFINDEAFLQAKPKDRAIMLAILLDKRQLLRGEPTQVLAIEDRTKLSSLAGLLLQEAKRRGFSVDATGPIIDVTPETVEQ